METLSTGIIQIGTCFEAYLVARINGKIIWREFSKIMRTNMDDAKNDAIKMADYYKSTNALTEAKQVKLNGQY